MPLLFNSALFKMYPLTSENSFAGSCLTSNHVVQKEFCAMFLCALRCFCFEGNGGNKSLSAREGTVGKVLRSGDWDDHHQSWKVRLMCSPRHYVRGPDVCFCFTLFYFLAYRFWNIHSKLRQRSYLSNWWTTQRSIFIWVALLTNHFDRKRK